MPPVRSRYAANQIAAWTILHEYIFILYWFFVAVKAGGLFLQAGGLFVFDNREHFPLVQRKAHVPDGPHGSLRTVNTFVTRNKGLRKSAPCLRPAPYRCAPGRPAAVISPADFSGLKS